MHLLSEIFIDSAEDLENLKIMREDALRWFYK